MLVKAMRSAAKTAPALFLISFGSLVDRMADDIPTWVIVLVMGSSGAIALALFSHFWSEDEINVEKVQNAIRDVLREDNAQVQSLEEIVQQLPSTPFGPDGMAYVELPKGTRAIRMPNGNIRIVLPVRVSGRLELVGLGGSDLKSDKSND